MALEPRNGQNTLTILTFVRVHDPNGADTVYKTPGEREIADPRVKAGPGSTLTSSGLSGSSGPWKAVPQTYAGVRFRSTLEADWAATLDHAGLTWSYEPEAVQLPSGTLYRPDFWLPQLECWMEVKGPGVPGMEKTIELASIEWVVIGKAPLRGNTHWDIIGPSRFTNEGRPEWGGINTKGFGIAFQLMVALGDNDGTRWAPRLQPMSRVPRRSA